MLACLMETIEALEMKNYDSSLQEADTQKCTYIYTHTYIYIYIHTPPLNKYPASF